MSYTVEKEWISDGYICVVIMTDIGHRCGYVGIPTKHPLYGKDYHKDCRHLRTKAKELHNEAIGKRGIIPVFCWDGKEASPEIVFDVHGGLTFSSNKLRRGDEYPIKRRGTWWFGYDCAHAGDAKDLSVVSPQLREIEERYPTGGELRSLDYCITECESLARQLAAVAK